MAASIVWAALRIAGSLQASRIDAVNDRSLRLLTAFAPALAAAEQDPRAVLVWEPVARAARRIFADEFALLDRAAETKFPFGAERIQAAHARWTSEWLAWEKAHGRIPEGSVVFVRSDWSKDWPDPALSTRTPFPGVSLDALKFLHEQRHILFHGHEPLDTDTTPTLEGEAWLMHNGYTQAEGVANLDQVPEVGALVAIGFPRLKGGVGGYASYVAICPPGTAKGERISGNDAPLPKSDQLLHWDTELGYRVR